MTGPLPAAVPHTGQPTTRVDGRLKVTGGARYAADQPVPDHLHAVLVCASRSTGALDGIDTAAAAGHRDVVSVLTTFPGLTLPYDIGRVNFYGQPLAVVVATTFEAATHGAALVTVRYREAAEHTDIADPAAPDQPSTRSPDYARGDADAALRVAPVSVDREYTIARNYHNPMEIPATIASWNGDRLTVWDKVQGVHNSRKAYSKAFGIPADRVRVISPFVGGAFGSAGQTWPHQLLAAAAARQLGRAAKLSLTRPQMYAAIGFRPTSRQRFALGADRDGRFTAAVHETTVEKSRYGTYEESPSEGTRLLYSCPAFRTRARVVPLDISEPTYMRGPGAVTGAFAQECAIDELAERLGMDPIELRLRNEPGRDPTNDTPFSTRRLTECFARGAETFGWSRRDARPASVREGDLSIGLGTAAAIYHTVRSTSSASARLNADGTVDVFAGTADVGPGTYTSMTQVAADALGLPLNRVRFTLGDSDLPEAAAQSGSRTMASVGSSINMTAKILRDRVIRMAVVDPGSPLTGLAPQDVTVTDGRIHAIADRTRGETYQDLLRRRRVPSLDVGQTYTPDDADDRFSMHAYGAVFAEVAVDTLLATVRVRRMYAVYDAGRVVNPRLAHSQAIGGMVGGIGMALLEAGETDHRDGRIVNANLSDYLVPVNGDVPALDAVFLDGFDDKADPIGVKGLGECVMVGVPAAVANAVHNATGKRLTELPITLEAVL